MNGCRFGICFLAVLLTAAPAMAGDFLDTRITFAVAEDDFFAPPGTTTINSPGLGVGAGRNNTVFFDNFNTRFSGFETLSNLSVYKRSVSFFDNLEGEAALNVTLIDLTSGAIQLFDNSSYVRLIYRPATWSPKEDVSFTGFPVSSDRFRLGYAWRVSWAGDSAFTFLQGTGPSTSGRPSATPGAKFQITRERWYAFAGFKTGLLQNGLIQAQERVYGALAGGGFDFVPQALRLEVNGGYFQRGYIPALAQQNIRAPAEAFGASAQFSFFSGELVQPSIDLRLYKNDPDLPARLFRPETYPGGLSYTVALEGSLLAQTLENPDRFGATSRQTASALALQARFKYNFYRLSLTGLLRTPSFIQFDVPGVIPFKDYPEGTTTQPELWASLGADRYFPRAHLTVGLIAGVQNPANLKTDVGLGGSNPSPTLLGQRTLVLRDVNTVTILPPDTKALLIFSTKATAKLDLSEHFTALAEVFYNRDPNRTTFRSGVAGAPQFVFENENQLGLNLVLSARF